MDELRATYDLSPHIDDMVRRVDAVMETAGREAVIHWLRDHGYTVIDPPECICYSHRDSRCRAHDREAASDA